jgi:hypothetical protein
VLLLLASPSHEGSRCGGCFWNRSVPPRSIAVGKAVPRLPERLFSAFEEADRYDCESKGRLHGLFCVLVLKILLTFYSVTTSDDGLPQWKEVLEWIVFSPKDLFLQDKNGQTILHHLCLFRAPVEIIQMALWQAPELASTANADGEIPLHWASRLSAPTECIRSLLKSDRASGTNFQDKDGHTPLSLLWDRHNSRFLEVWWENNDKLHSLPAWKRILMFFEEEGETTAPSPLHVAARTACPPALFPLMIQVYRDQLLIVDDDGRNPLQLACSDPVSNRSTDVKSKIEFLLQEDPRGAHNEDHQGRTAFYIALESGIAWNEGVKGLFELGPHTLSKKDPHTGMPPFLLAVTGASNRLEQARKMAMGEIACEEKSLETIFTLLKAYPACLQDVAKC